VAWTPEDRAISKKRLHRRPERGMIPLKRFREHPFNETEVDGFRISAGRSSAVMVRNAKKRFDQIQECKNVAGA